MKIQIKKEIVITSIVAMLLFSIGCSTMAMPSASAHTPEWQITTYAYINVAPSPIGVGQTATVVMWLEQSFEGAALGNDWRFHNYQLTITAPDGTNTTKTFEYISDPTSSLATAFVPTQVGTYSFTFQFPGQSYNEYGHNPTSAYVNDTYLPSTANTTLIVQQEPIQGALSSPPLPTEYWTRPIYGENTGWWVISSNWLGTGAGGYSTISPQTYAMTFPTDAVGPLTSHIMWTKPLQSGGVVGGDNSLRQGATYFEGSAYSNRFTNPIILDGKLYYTEPISFLGTPGSILASLAGEQVNYGPTVCVNLRTGELIWSRTDVPALSFGYIYDVETPNQHGVYLPILIATAGTTWKAYDADTGNWLFDVINTPSGATAMGPQGEQLRYVFANAGTATNPNWTLGEWNSSKLWSGAGFSGDSSAFNDAFSFTNPSSAAGYSPYINGTVDGSISTGANSRYSWNVSIPWYTSMGSATVVAAFYGNMLICYNGTLPTGTQPLQIPSSSPYTYFAINLNESKAPIGSILWKNTINPPAGNKTVKAGVADPTTGVFTEFYLETQQFIGYSMATGAKLWGPTAPQTAFDYYFAPYASAYGNLYSCGFGGILYCYNMSNGNIEWTYGNGAEGNSTSAGFNTAYGVYPTFIQSIGNGVVYLITSEHTITNPIYKGAEARAVNATDGKEIWTLSDYTGEISSPSFAIADGYATFFNGYDNQIYVVGKGPSQTTVSAPNIAATLGQSIIISGAVTDISAGTTQDEQSVRFPNGVAVASDASMKDWMGYVYQQQTCPTNFTGVPVTISVLDANGNYRTIGTTTTDASGSYGLQWTPDVPGKYTVVASFAGTNGYWSSYAQTYFAVDEPAATPTPQPTQPPSAADLYFVPGIIGVIAAIIIVGLVLLLALRKRP